MLKLGEKRRKTVADKSNKTDKVKKTLLRPVESTQPSQVKPIREKTIIKTGIIWAEGHAICVRSHAIIVKKWAIMQTSALNLLKTNFSLNNILVDSWS